MCYVQLRSSGKRARHIPTRTDPTVGLLRNMSCSSCVCVIQIVKERHKATTPNFVPHEKVDCDGTICKLVCCLLCYSDVASLYKQYEQIVL